MTSEAFDILLVRRDELARKHERACAMLEEEPHPINHKRCARLYDELEAVQKQIDAAIAEERAQ
jgi:hypothetical protein